MPRLVPPRPPRIARVSRRWAALALAFQLALVGAVAGVAIAANADDPVATGTDVTAEQTTDVTETSAPATPLAAAVPAPAPDAGATGDAAAPVTTQQPPGRVPGPTGFVTGRVVDGDGLPLPGLSVIAGDGTEPLGGLVGTTGPDGRYLIDTVPVGPVVVSISDLGGLWVPQSIAANVVEGQTTTVDLVLREVRTGTVGGVIWSNAAEDSTEQDITIYLIDEDGFERATTDVEDGAFVFRDVDPGTYTLAFVDQSVDRAEPYATSFLGDVVDFDDAEYLDLNAGDRINVDVHLILERDVPTVTPTPTPTPTITPAPTPTASTPSTPPATATPGRATGTTAPRSPSSGSASKSGALTVAAPAPAAAARTAPFTVAQIIAEFGADTEALLARYLTETGQAVPPDLAALVGTGDGTSFDLAAFTAWVDWTAADTTVAVFGYSTPTYLGRFSVADGQVQLVDVDLASLGEGDHQVLLVGDQTGEFQVASVAVPEAAPDATAGAGTAKPADGAGAAPAPATPVSAGVGLATGWIIGGGIAVVILAVIVLVFMRLRIA